MHYTPSTTGFGTHWHCWSPEEPDQPHLLPLDLFQKLKAGHLMPESTYFLATRTYETEAEAMADLQQAEQAQQKQNPFESASVLVDRADSV